MAATSVTMRQSLSVSASKASTRRFVVPRAALLTDVRVAKKTSSQKQQQAKAPLAGFEIGFTPENEVFVGRMAMLGFATSVVGEYLSGGQGALAQLGYNFGLEQGQVGLFLAGLIGFNLVASLLPNSATFRQQPQQQEAVGPLQDPRITVLQPAKFFGITNWGFTAQNELFAGRMAQLGFLAAILGELATGLGPVGQLSAETGIPAQAIFFGLAAWASFMACTAVDKLTGKRDKKTTKDSRSGSVTTTQV